LQHANAPEILPIGRTCPDPLPKEPRFQAIERDLKFSVDLRTRFAVDAYVNFARCAPWPEAVCASLNEVFAPEIDRQRLARWPQHYPWIDPSGLEYFQTRAGRARRDVEFALAATLERFTTRASQERALEVLQFKLDILWQMNGAMALAYGLTS
jgi:pyrroloquinoline-quinone synthase